MSRYVYSLSAILIVLLAFWLRTADLKSIPPGLHFDDGRKIQHTWRLTAGYGLPLNFLDAPEPFDRMIRAGFMRLSGGYAAPFQSQMFSVWLNVLAVAATTAAASELFRQHPHRRTIALAAALTLAALPPAIVLGRHVYRANWLPAITILALAFVARSWRTRRSRDFLLAGALVGLGTLFYLSGLFFPPAVILIVGINSLLVREQRPKIGQIGLTLAAFCVVMMPWLYLYFRIPNWLMRVGDLVDRDSPLSNPALLAGNIVQTILPIFRPDSLHFPRYNTFTTAFLHPVQVFLFAVGAGVSIYRWQRAWSLAPLLLGLVMLWPNILSSEPYQPIRLVGVFGPLALLVGLGTGEILRFVTASGKRLALLTAKVGLAGFFISLPLYSAYHVWYHFKAQPMLTNPNVPESWAYIYRLGYADFLRTVIDSDQPVYFPVEYANTDLGVDLLRPRAFPVVRAYDGRPLPEGRVMLPVNSIIYGFFPLEHSPAQYILALPESGELLILPPLPLTEAQELEGRIRQQGEDIINDEGWILGQSLTINAAEHPFDHLTIATAEVLAVFDERLELVGLEAPSELRAGDTIPVTLYWRLREATGKDYFSRLQVWDYAGSNRGTENRPTFMFDDDTSLSILSYIYPTPMWQAGEMVAETRWLPVFDDAPAGGYRFAVGLYDYPGPMPVPAQPVGDLAQTSDHWILAGRSVMDAGSFNIGVTSSDEPIALVGSAFQLDRAEFDPPLSSLSPGQTVEIRLVWETLQASAESYTLFIHLVDSGGRIIAQEDGQPFQGRLPTWAWLPGSSVTTTHSLTTQAEATAPFSVFAGMYAYPSLERLPVIQAGIESPDRVIVISP